MNVRKANVHFKSVGFAFSPVCKSRRPECAGDGSPYQKWDIITYLSTDSYSSYQ